MILGPQPTASSPAAYGALVLIGSRLGLFHEGLDRGPATGHWASLDGESQDSRGGFKHGKPMAYT